MALKAGADPVSAALGSFGPWQARSILLLALIKIPAGWQMLSIMFLAPNPEIYNEKYVCARDDPVNISLTDWIETRHPEDQRYASGFNPCYVYTSRNESNPVAGVTLEECEKFEFFVSSPTMVTQWSLVCKRSVLVSVVQMFYILGVASGGIVAFISRTRFSPRMLILAGTVLQVIAGTAGALQPLYEVHCFLKYLIGLGTCLMFTSANQINISTGWRKTVFSVSFEFFWSVGVISMGWIDAATNTWSDSLLLISIPSIFFLIMGRIIPDSPRWLIAHGKFKSADDLLKLAAASNGRELPKDFSTKKTIGPPERNHQRLPKFKVFCLQILWIGTIVHYYGALLNIRNVGGPPLPLRSTYAGVAEIIGTAIGLILLLRSKYKFGLLSLLLLIGGIGCVSSYAIQPNESGRTRGWTMFGLSMMGRIPIACSLAIMTNGSLELLPGERRPLVGAAMVVVARAVLTTTPFLSNLAFYDERITVAAYGCLALFAAFGAFGIFITTEWRTLLGLCIREKFNPHAEAQKNCDDGRVVCTSYSYYSDQDVEYMTSIAA